MSYKRHGWELTNPSGVYAEEFARIRDEILKSEKPKQKPKQNPSLLKRIKNLFLRINLQIMTYEVITWPEVQELMGLCGFE